MTPGTMLLWVVAASLFVWCGVLAFLEALVRTFA